METLVERGPCSRCGKGIGRWLVIAGRSRLDGAVLCDPCQQDLFAFLRARGTPPVQAKPTAPDEAAAGWVTLMELTFTSATSRSGTSPHSRR